MKPISLLLALLVFLSFVSRVSAAQISEIEHLRELFRAGDSETAYAMALQMLDRFEGDQEFDFLFGASAVDTGHNSLGVFALERAHAVQPDNDLIKLELARGLFKLGINGRAYQLFEEVLANNPPPAVRQRVEGYMQVIQRMTASPKYSVKGFADLGGGFDSNVNSGPDNQPNLVNLSAAAMETEDLFTQQRVGGELSYRYEPGHVISADIEVTARQYQDVSSQSYSQAAIGFTHDWILKDGGYTLGINMETYDLDGRAYRRLFGVYGQWNKVLDESARLRSTLSWYQLRYEDLGYRDADQLVIDSTYFRSVSGDLTPIWYAGIFAGHTLPKRVSSLSLADVKRDFVGVNVGVRLNIADRIWLTPGLTYQDQQFAGESWLYGTKRRDRFYGPNLKADWRINSLVTLSLNASALRNKSNIDLYNYDRKQLMLSARLSF